MSGMGWSRPAAEQTADSEKDAGDASREMRTLGTYLGVFRPTLLTILGVILYLRVGWVVGHGGILGAAGVVLLTFALTGATALSFSSVATNVRMGGGGAFFIVARSLGVEAGGAIGVPLYLAQALSVAFYMHGLSDAWLYMFPTHPRAAVLGAVFVLGFGLALLSEKLVLRSQIIVLVGVIFALGSMWSGVLTVPALHAPELIGSFEGAGFWELFAVFFPAGTGIMVGVSMSGKLRDPRRSIPRGILMAWGVALVCYLLTAVWLSVTAAPQALRDDSFVAVTSAGFGPGVLVGLTASCASAALGSIVAAPNVLLALAKHRVVPGSRWLGAQSEGGTPRVAVALTATITGLALAFGDLDSVARVITVFFLLTYATVNVVVAVEQSLGTISFRPSLRVPLAVPVIGAFGTTAVLLQSEPMLGFASIVFVVVGYAFLARRGVDNPYETVRSGLVVAIAHWVAQVVQGLVGPQYRAWKPDLLFVLSEAGQLPGAARLLGALARDKGSVQVLAILDPDAPARDALRLDRVVEDLRDEGIIATHVEIPGRSMTEATRVAAGVLAPTLVRPNVLFVNTSGRSDAELGELERIARADRMGLAVLDPDPDAGLGSEKRVVAWVRYQQDGMLTAVGRSNIDLLLLFAYQLQKNWQAELTLATIAAADEEEDARAFLGLILSEARLPSSTRLEVIAGAYPDALADGPTADLHLLGLPGHLDRATLEGIRERARASCLFVEDSGEESAFA